MDGSIPVSAGRNVQVPLKAAPPISLTPVEAKRGKIEIEVIGDRCKAATRQTEKLLRGSSRVGAGTLESKLAEIQTEIASIESDYQKVSSKYPPTAQLARAKTKIDERLAKLKGLETNLRHKVEAGKAHPPGAQPGADAVPDYSLVTDGFGSANQAKVAKETDQVAKESPVGKAAEGSNKSARKGFFAKIFRKKAETSQASKAEASSKKKINAKPVKTNKVGFLRRVFGSNKAKPADMEIGRVETPVTVRGVAPAAEVKMDKAAGAISEVKKAQLRHHYVMDAEIALLKELQPHLGKKDREEIRQLIVNLEMTQAFERWASTQVGLFVPEKLMSMPEDQRETFLDGVATIYSSVWSGPTYKAYRDNVNAIAERRGAVEKIMDRVKKKASLPLDGKKVKYDVWARDQVTHSAFQEIKVAGTKAIGEKASLDGEFRDLVNGNGVARVILRQPRTTMPLEELYKELNPESIGAKKLRATVDQINLNNEVLNNLGRNKK